MTLEPPIVKDRMLLHLWDYREYSEKVDVPIEMTQQGVAKAVWIDVRHVVQYVRPLIGEGLVRERTAHVLGGRRKRKVYDLTDAGKLKAYEVRKRLEPGLVRVRDVEGTRETSVSELLRETGGRIPLIEVLRQVVHTGSVDITMPEAPEGVAYVAMVADAPRVEEFLGRAEELASILEDGPRPSVFVIRGVAGVGKSTLAARICELRRGSLHLFWHRVRSWDTPQSMLAELAAFLAAMGRPGLRTVLSKGEAGLGPQVLRDEMVEVRAILVIDDAHEGSRDVVSFLRFLKEVAAEAKDVKLLVLTRKSLTFYDRRDVVLDLLVREIDLGGLEPAVLEGIIQREQLADLPPSMIRHPLFLKLLKSATGPAAREKARRDIRQFLEEAVYAELSDDERRMMKIASLYRVPVPPGALFLEEAMTEDVLMGVRSRSLLTPVGGDALEVHDTIRDFFAALVTEGERAELGLRAIPQLRRLASESRAQGNLPTCIGYLSNALELRPEGPERLTIAEELGDVQEKIGALDGCLAAYNLGLQGALDPESIARLHRKTAAALVSRGEISRASAAIERGFEALGTRVSVEQGWLHLAKSQVSEWQEEFEDADDHAIAALETFESFGDREGQCRALLLLGWIENNMTKGKPSTTKEYLERALELAEPADDPVAIVDAHLLLTVLYAHRLGNVERGRDHLEAAEEVARSQGGDFSSINLLTVKGNFLLHLESDLVGAETALSEAETLSTKLHSEGRLAFVRQSQAWLDYYREDFSKARERLLWFAEKMRGRGLDPSVVESLCMAAECALLEGDVDEFERIGVSLEDQELLKGFEAKPIMTGVVRAASKLLNGEEDECRAMLARAAETEEGGLVFDPAMPLIYSAAVAGAAGRETEASRYVERATQLLDTLSLRSQLSILPTRVQLLTRTLEAVDH